MLKMNILSRQTAKDKLRETFSISSPFLILAAMMVLLLGVALGIYGPYAEAVVIGTLIMTIMIILRQNELIATFVILIRLYVDWYLGISVITQLITLALLFIFFLTRSSQYPWVKPRTLWLWGLFLIVAIFPAIRGINIQDGIYYYSNIIFSPLILLWLGMVIAPNVTVVRKLLKALSYFGTFIAIIAIIQTTTGSLLFGTTRFDAYLASISDYTVISGSGVDRIGTFFVNPNPSGAFFAMMLLVSLGLFVESTSLLEKALYLGEIIIILPALLFTYSTNSWLSSCVGVLVFLVFVGRNRYRILLPFIIIGFGIVMIAFFPKEISLLLEHATLPQELALRTGAWKTGIQVIHAFPLTGIGLGRYVYVVRAEPYRVIEQYVPLDHPHKSYLELTALGGFPVGIMFIVILSFTLWKALRNWGRVDVNTRALLGGSIASTIALSFFSLSDAGWTTPPLLAIGWLILGAVSSPLIIENRVRREKKEEKL